MKITRFDGYICDKSNTIIGDYSYSFYYNSFTLYTNGHVHNQLKKTDLEKFLKDNNYHILEEG